MSPIKPLLGETDMSEFLRPDEKPINPDNVWEDDAFRSLGKYATFLTKALTANKKNFVLNVNGPWGTGKSFFVQRWAADLRKHYPVIEYNAWENDSEDDPLSSLLAVCAEGLKEHFSDKQNLIDDLKKKGGRIALRLSGFVAKAGLRKIFGDGGIKEICDIYSEATENDLIDLGGTLVEEQIKKQQERKSFVEELKKLLDKLEENNKLPVFIFIDELDRCRPTFAIELLERVKHLFGVDRIKFIISTDTEQLTHSISRVYGDRFNGYVYLQRFFDETFTLPSPDARVFSTFLLRDVDSNTARWQKNKWFLIDSPSASFGGLAWRLKLTLREQVRAYGRVMAVTGNIDALPGKKLHFMFICVLVMLLLKYHDDYRAILSCSDKLEAWRKFRQTHGIPVDQIDTIVTHYFVSMTWAKHEYLHYERKLESDFGIHGNPMTPAYALICDICTDCYMDYDDFRKYQKLIELTETLS